MLKEYRKTATIKAEQFDGSKEMMDKYHLGFWKGQDTGEIYEYSIPTKEGVLDLNIGDWIATGVEGEHWAIDDEIFKKTYEEVKSDPGYMQYINSTDMYAKGVYIDATPCKTGGIE
jgi:hypothetical protein|nr:MAG TPA: PGDYG protein [Caudoviricetes sp.]